MQFKRSVFFTILWISGFTSAFSQATRSPFSALGIGDRYSNALAPNQGMGGAGVANPQYWYLNNINPALLVYNNFTVLEGGIIGEGRTIKGSESQPEKNSGANINYFAVGLPVKPGKWTASVGLMPYSFMKSEVFYTQSILGSPNTVNVVESANGGINQAYLSNGFRVYKNLNAGIKVMYLFSSLERDFRNTLSTTSQTYPFISSVSEQTYFNDINLSGGLSYRIDSLGRKKNKFFTLGMTYEANSKIRTEFTRKLTRYSATGSLLDSLTLSKLSGSTSIPGSFAFGVSYGRPGYWSVAADATYLDYTTLRDFQDQRMDGRAAWKYAAGAEFTPEPTSIGNYLKRMTYRTGVSYEELPYSVNGRAVKDFGITFGLSMPVGRFSNLNFGAKWGKRGDLKTTTIEENYFKLYFGVTFNDQWFIKRKFD